MRAYSELSSDALQHEQTVSPLTDRYRMQRVQRWLKRIIPTDYLELNDQASNEGSLGTSFRDGCDDQTALLADEKQSNAIERTDADHRRALQLFRAEIDRKLQRQDLLLTRIELDLYVL